MDVSLQRKIRFLMSKYLENKCTIRELEELFDIINRYPNDKTVSDIIDLESRKVSATEENIPEALSQSIFEAIQRGYAEREQPDVEFPVSRSRSRMSPYVRIAAAILLVAVCSVLLMLIVQQPGYQIVRTAYGEIREVVLPDQSVVTLNGNSTLQYNPTPENGSVREVTISGEAFFHVVHTNDNQKFRVHTSNSVTVEVLGTEFSINERHTRTRVVLHTGKILLDIGEQEGHKDILMNSGELVEVDEGDDRILRKKVDSGLYISWKDKMLVFKDTPLRDIVAILEDRYGIKTVVNDSLVLDEQFTATYPSDNIDVLIKALEKSFAIKSDSDGGSITIGE